ncbi:hypothetical protein AB0C07_17195 [Actinoplanes missouriensis]|uniref:hypothetical protein n=1 Tax=Actinoplanes missouriensis TaxID=1866 RepID=UPI0033D1C3FD
MGSGWLGRRRSPRLSGTLHLRDATGREVAVPLRGRATVLTADGTGLTGYGEVWAVHTEADRAATSLMISYGRDGAEGDRAAGLCAAGETVVLGGVSFTWRHQPADALRPRITADTPATSDADATADAPVTSDAGATEDVPAASHAGATADALAASDVHAAADAPATDALDISVMPGMPSVSIPRQRENMPRVVGASQAANIRAEPTRTNPLHNMLRLVKQVSRSKRSTNPAPSSSPPPSP